MDETVRRARRFCGLWHAMLVHSFNPFHLFSFFQNSLWLFLNNILLEVWALEMESIIGISHVIDDRFHALARRSASRAWKRDLARVYLHREHLNALTFDEVPD